VLLCTVASSANTAAIAASRFSPILIGHALDDLRRMRPTLGPVAAGLFPSRRQPKRFRRSIVDYRAPPFTKAGWAMDLKWVVVALAAIAALGVMLHWLGLS